jgi:hypothetical protein
VFFRERETESTRTLEFLPYHLLQGPRSAVRSVEVPLTPSGPLPVLEERQALARSYGPAFTASWILGETHPFAAIRPVPGGFDVFWYSLEMTFWGRAAGVLAHVEAATGRVTTRSRWSVPHKAFD